MDRSLDLSSLLLHPRARRIVAASSVALLACALALSGTLQPRAGAFEVKDTSTTNLDGNVVMSPAAERVKTTYPEGSTDAAGEPLPSEPIEPGSTAIRNVILQNRSEQVKEFTLDVAQVVGSSAEQVVEVRHGVRQGAAAWATLERSSLTLKPGQQATIQLEIEIPAAVTPGAKPFAVVATQQGGGADQVQGAGIAPQFKQNAIFIVEIPGDAPVGQEVKDAGITSRQAVSDAIQDGEDPPKGKRLFAGTHDLTAHATVVNEGEILISAKGKVVVDPLFGTTQTFPFEKVTAYPQGQAALDVPLEGLPSLGLFSASIELDSEAGSETIEVDRFLVAPWWFLVAAGVLLLVGIPMIVLGTRSWIQRRKAWKEYYAQLEAFEGAGDEDGEWIDEDDEGWDEDQIAS